MRLVDGDTASAVDSLLLRRNLSALFDDEPLLICRLSQVACEVMWLESLEEVLGVAEPTERQLDHLAKAVDETLASSSMRWPLRGERTFLVAQIHPVVAGVPVVPGGAAVPGSRLLARTTWGYGGAEGLAMLNRLIERSDDPKALLAEAKAVGARTEGSGLFATPADLLHRALRVRVSCMRACLRIGRPPVLRLRWNGTVWLPAIFRRRSRCLCPTILVRFPRTSSMAHR